MLSNEELLRLIELARSEDERTRNLAARALWNAFQPWIRARVESYRGNDSIDCFDVISACNAALWNTSQTFDLGLTHGTIRAAFLNWLQLSFFTEFEPIRRSALKTSRQLSTHDALFHEEEFADPILIDRLNKNINFLSDQCKELLYERFWEEKSYPSIAEGQPYTARTAKNKVDRIISKLNFALASENSFFK